MCKTKIEFTITFVMVLLSNIMFSQGSVYFSDVALDKIFVSDIDGSNVTPILEASKVIYKKIDEAEGKLYLSDYGRGAIVRIDLDGANEEILVSGLSNAKGIAVDETTIFICDGESILSYDKSGGFNGELIKDLDYNIRGLEVHGDFLYIAGQKNFDGRIEKFTKEGVFVARILDEISSPIHIKIDGDDNRIYWNQNTNSDSNSGLYSATLDGSDQIRHLDITIRGFDIDFETKDVYWTRSNTGFTLYYSNFNDLEDRELIVDYLSGSNSVLIDKSNSRLILASLEFDNVLVSFDIKTGNNRKDLLKKVVNNPEKMAIDESNGVLYWVNSNSGFLADKTQAILRSDLDGSNVEKMLNKDDGLDRPSDILYNDLDGYVYWVDNRTSMLKKINPADYTDQEVVFEIENADLVTFDTDGVFGNFYLYDSNTGMVIKKNVNTGDEEAILDTEGNYIYSIERGGDKLFLTGLSQGSIVSCDLDGTNLDTIIVTENPVFHRPTALSYSEKDDRLYFTISFSGEKIQSCNPDGSDLITLIPDGLEAPDGIVVIGDNLSSVQSQKEYNVSISLSPNPSSNLLNITTTERLKQVSIYNQLGEIMIQYNEDNIEMVIDISELKSGTYHFRAFTMEGRMASDSFIKL